METYRDEGRRQNQSVHRDLPVLVDVSPEFGIREGTVTRDGPEGTGRGGSYIEGQPGNKGT